MENIPSKNKQLINTLRKQIKKDNIIVNKINMIVERNEYGDIKWIDEGTTVAEFINGREFMYKGVERGLVGYTIKLRGNLATTWVNLQSQEEALDTINNHIDKWNKSIKELNKMTSEYLSSDEGAWGR